MQHLLDDIRGIIASTRERVARSVNHELTVAYWHIGKRLVEEEQGGHERAEYGKRLVTEIAQHLHMNSGAAFRPITCGG